MRVRVNRTLDAPRSGTADAPTRSVGASQGESDVRRAAERHCGRAHAERGGEFLHERRDFVGCDAPHAERGCESG